MAKTKKIKFYIALCIVNMGTLALKKSVKNINVHMIFFTNFVPEM